MIWVVLDSILCLATRCNYEMWPWFLAVLVSLTTCISMGSRVWSLLLTRINWGSWQTTFSSCAMSAHHFICCLISCSSLNFDNQSIVYWFMCSCYARNSNSPQTLSNRLLQLMVKCSVSFWSLFVYLKLSWELFNTKNCYLELSHLLNQWQLVQVKEI